MMNSDKEKHDALSEYLRRRLESHQMMVDDSCWDKIHSQIKPVKRTKLRWVAFSAAAAIVLLFLLITPYLTNIDKDNVAGNSVSGSDNQFEDASSISQPDLYSDEVAKADSEKLPDNLLASYNPSKKAGNSAEKVTPPSVDTPFPEKNSSANEGKEPELPTIADKEARTLTTEEKKPENESKNIYPDLPGNSFDTVISINPKKKENKWQLGASVGSNANNIGPNISNNMSSMKSQTVMQAVPEINREEMLSVKDFDDIKYSMPLSFGLTVRKNLQKNFAIESGIVYTYLSTKFGRSGSSTNSAKLELHYLGIPLNGVFYIYNGQNWDIYLSGGGMVEKGIKSRYTQDKVSNDKVESTLVKRELKGVQWSLQGAAGAAYNFYDNWNFFIEPKVGYYFDNNQPVSIRTKKPFSFGLAAGLRYEF